MTAQVTIGIPAWKAEGFLGRTLDAARAQTFGDVRILVSVDVCDDGTQAVARDAAAEDRRVEVVVQPERRGWVGNMNAILDRADTPYFMILPHDDLLDERYVQRLLPVVESDPETVCAYCDIRLFDGTEGRFSADLPTGGAYERMVGFLSGWPNGVALRGITRSSVARAGVRLRNNSFSGFLAGTVYVLELLRHGNCVRVPEVLYRKWVRSTSVHEAEWKSWERPLQLAAWAEHTRSCLEAIEDSDLPTADRYGLVAACMTRLRRSVLPGGPLHDPDADADADAMKLFTLVAGRLAGIEAADAAATRRLGEDPDLAAARARRLYAEAIRLREGGDAEEAAQLLAKSAAADPGYADAHLQLSATLYDLGDVERGLEAARRAAALSPADARAHHMVSQFEARTGALDAAERSAARAVELDPDNRGVADHLAWVRSEMARSAPE